jgi:hypothetical protein
MESHGRSFPHIDSRRFIHFGTGLWLVFALFEFLSRFVRTNKQQFLHPYSTLILQSRVSLMKQTPSQDPVRHPYFEEITSVHLL